MIWSKDREYSYLFFSNRVDKNTNEFCVINDILLASICDIYKISKQEKFAALRSKKINLKFQKFPLQNVSNTPPNLEQVYSKKYFLEQARPSFQANAREFSFFRFLANNPFPLVRPRISIWAEQFRRVSVSPRFESATRVFGSVITSGYTARSVMQRFSSEAKHDTRRGSRIQN